MKLICVFVFTYAKVGFLMTWLISRKEFLIANCHANVGQLVTGSRTLVLAVFDPSLFIIKNVFDHSLSDVVKVALSCHSQK